MVAIMGREISTPWILGGSAVGIGAVLWYRHNKKNQQTTQDQNAAPATPDGIDPNTGQPYAAEYGNYTYQPEGAGYGPSGLGDYGGYGGGGGFGDGYYNAGVPYPVQQQATTNAQWTQAALSALTAQGYEGTQVLAALGLFLTGGHLSASQASIVQAAIAVEGYPPQGPNTINQGPPIGQPPGEPPPANTALVPNIVGMNYINAVKDIKAMRLVPKGPVVAKSKQGTWIVHNQSPKANTPAKIGSTVTFSGKQGG
jgi:hypothetical protein